MHIIAICESGLGMEDQDFEGAAASRDFDSSENNEFSHETGPLFWDGEWDKSNLV